MTSVKTCQLSGSQLDWAVAKCAGVVTDDIDDFCLRGEGEYCFSTDWSQGGPIIERNLLVLSPNTVGGWIARSYMDLAEHLGGNSINRSDALFRFQSEGK